MICPKATGSNVHFTTSPGGVVHVGFSPLYYCHPKLTLQGSLHRTCLPGGVRSGHPPTCTCEK